MKLPKKIKILGREIKIKEVPTKELIELSGVNASGLYDHLSLKIYIAKDLPEKEKMLVLRHEFCHSVMFITGLSQVINGDVQEIICESFANAMSDLFKK